VFRVSETSEEYIKVASLKSGFRNVNLIVKVVDVRESRVTFSRRDRSEHRISEALVGDETGVVLLTLWDDQIDIFFPDNVFEIKNSFTSLFKGSLRLNIGRTGRIKKFEKEIEVNTENNLSEVRHQETYWQKPEGRGFRRRRRRF
jgi:replication factor A1